MNVDGLVERIHDMVEGISAYLHDVVMREGRLPARSFYGESFSALLLYGRPATKSAVMSLLYERYREKDKEDPSFHWEFNKYAWMSLYKGEGETTAAEFAAPLRFRNTPVTNWALLRSCVRLMAGEEEDVGYREAGSVLRRFQLRSGLICDQPYVRSFQYHCFSAILVAEIHAMGGKEFFLERFRRAVDFIVPFVLRSGDTLYVGRGQEQSFGYGALAYLLALAFRSFGDMRYLSCLERVIAFLGTRRRPDGSFPLVMNDVEKGFPLSSEPSNHHFPGWYAYNNYFDYLPFLGVFLKKTEKAIGGVQPVDVVQAEQAGDYRDGHFIIVRKAGYEAVLSRPGGGWRGGEGYWTNDLPIPYVCRGGVRLTPSYGGEQFGSLMYTPSGIPLPMVVRKGRKVSFRSGRIWSFFFDDRLVVVTPRGVLVRQFLFLETAIIIDDRILCRGGGFARYLFDQVERVDDRSFVIRGGARIESSIPMNLAESGEYYWGGPLQSIEGRAPSYCCRITIRWD